METAEERQKALDVAARADAAWQACVDAEAALEQELGARTGQAPRRRAAVV